MQPDSGVGATEGGSVGQVHVQFGPAVGAPLGDMLGKMVGDKEGI